jgi:hypothetical protein
MNFEDHFHDEPNKVNNLLILLTMAMFVKGIQNEVKEDPCSKDPGQLRSPRGSLLLYGS